MGAGRSNETAVLLLSDPHYGKETVSYSPERCKARIRLAGERMASIRSMLSPSIAFDKLVVLILGDVNDGTDIFAGQCHEQAITNVEEQARECAEMLRDFLTEQRTIWGTVEAYCVAGNHGRAGRKDSNVSERANWDIVCYRYLKLHLAPLGIHVDIDDRRPFLRVVNIRGHGVLCHHGHFVSAGILPGPALMRRLTNWSLVKSIPSWSLAVMGHYHSPMYFRQSSIQMLLSGTLVSDDSYPIEKLGVESPPAWWFFGVSNKHIPSWQFLLELDDRKPTEHNAGPHNPEPSQAPSPHVHGREVIVEPVQASARIVSSSDAPLTTSQHISKPPLTKPAKVPYGTCTVCAKPFSPTWNTQRVCPACRTFTCAWTECAKVVVMEKFARRQKFCSPACDIASRRAQAEARRAAS